jgi:hypothetical protein
MRRPSRTVPVLSAALTALAALAVLTGCGTHDETPRTPLRITPLHGSAAPRASKQPMRPDAELTPATGSFTAKEKSYLHDRVPADTDPAAILQLGQEACQRVAYTARHDRDAAIGAVITGDIPGAKDAIEPLCPDQLPVLRAARGGFADGTKKNPAVGRYRALMPTASCTWQATGSGGRVLASGRAHGSGKVTAQVPSGTREFASSGCYAWARD